jgi:hypothetical protein
MTHLASQSNVVLMTKPACMRDLHGRHSGRLRGGFGMCLDRSFTQLTTHAHQALGCIRLQTAPRVLRQVVQDRAAVGEQVGVPQPQQGVRDAA